MDENNAAIVWKRAALAACIAATGFAVGCASLGIACLLSALMK